MKKGKQQLRDRINWKWQRHKKDKCEDCGAIEHYYVDKYRVRRKILTVHHMDGNIENNDSTNLRTLCKKCHQEIEQLIKRERAIGGFLF